MFKNALLNLLLLILLTACATQTPMSIPTVQNQQSWEERQKSLVQLTQWQAEGVLSIQTIKGTDTAQFVWQLQGQNKYNLRFMGPVGTGYGTLKTTPTQSMYLAPKGKIYSDRNAQALLTQVTGWQLPVDDLYYWARGLAAPSATTNLQFDANHSYLLALEQDGFRVNFQNYSSVGALDLPSRLLIQNEAIKVKIVITHWQLN